jgi:hypothetical protein
VSGRVQLSFAAIPASMHRHSRIMPIWAPKASASQRRRRREAVTARQRARTFHTLVSKERTLSLLCSDYRHYQTFWRRTQRAEAPLDVLLGIAAFVWVGVPLRHHMGYARARRRDLETWIGWLLLLGLVLALVQGLRGKVILQDLAFPPWIPLVLLIACVSPGSLVLLNADDDRATWWQVSFAFIAVYVIGMLATSRLVRVIRRFLQIQYLARWVDERILGLLLLFPAGLITILSSGRDARRQRHMMGTSRLGDERLYQTLVCNELDDLADHVSIMFTYSARRSWDPQITLRIRSRGRSIEGAVRTQAALASLPGHDLEHVKETLLADYAHVVRGRWDELVQGKTDIGEHLSFGTRFVGRAVVTSILVGAALSAPHVPQLIPRTKPTMSRRP